MRLRPGVSAVVGDLARIVLPRDCAGCGASTGRARRLSGPTGELLVPYCAPCLSEIAWRETLGLAALVAALLLVLCFAFAFPLLWPSASLIAHVFSTLVIGLAPFLGVRLAALRSPGAAPSVWWLGDGSLACARSDFARAVAELNQLGVERRWAFFAGVRSGSALVLGLGACAAAGAYVLEHPKVRVLNSSGERLWLTVDGAPMGVIESSSIESPADGLELRLPRGARELALADARGKSVATARVTLSSRHEHLFAPQQEGRCFWLEITGYGKEHGRRVLPLESPNGFWTLKAAPDLWFAPNPQPAQPGSSWSGGTVTALRQAPCELAPEPVRAARSALGPPSFDAERRSELRELTRGYSDR